MHEGKPIHVFSASDPVDLITTLVALTIIIGLFVASLREIKRYIKLSLGIHTRCGHVAGSRMCFDCTRCSDDRPCWLCKNYTGRDCLGRELHEELVVEENRIYEAWREKHYGKE